MRATITNIELITEVGTFNFAPHFNTTADPYQALCMFEANNWKNLGNKGFEYKVYNLWEDGTKSIDTYSGINATANLSEVMDSAHCYASDLLE